MALAGGGGRHTEYTKYTANAHNETFTLHSCAISRESFMQMFYAKICVPGRRLDSDAWTSCRWVETGSWTRSGLGERVQRHFRDILAHEASSAICSVTFIRV